MRRKDVDHTVNRGGSRVRVQGAESEVAGFGDTQRRFNGFQVAHFADQHHVRVFTKCGAQGVAERFRVRVNFALVHQAVLVLVNELDRIFNGDNVIVALGVDLVDHRRQSRRFSRTGRTCDQNETARLIAQLRDNRRQVQLLERANLEWDYAENSAGSAALIKQVAAEPSEPFEAEREV